MICSVASPSSPSCGCTPPGKSSTGTVCAAAGATARNSRTAAAASTERIVVKRFPWKKRRRAEARRRNTLQQRDSGALAFLDRLDRQADAALLVDLEHLHLDDVAFLELVGNLLDALVGDLRHVHEAVLARGDRH